MSTATLHVIGNVQLDVLANPVSRLPVPGGDEIVEEISVRPAGAAGNVSLALHALGVRHRLFGVLGDDYAGRWVAQELDRLGLAADLTVLPGQATGISIALEAPGRERAFLTAHGVLAGYGVESLAPDAVRADLVLVTGYFSLPRLRGEATADLLGRARAAGARTLLDTGWDPENFAGSAAKEVLDLLPLVDVFLPNEPEALALTGADDVHTAAGLLHDRCPGWVVLKRGAAGVLATGPDGRVLALPAPPAVPLDTTGAGDSLAAGMLAELVVGHDVPAALLTGVRVASTVVARPSTDRYPSRDQLLG